MTRRRGIGRHLVPALAALLIVGASQAAHAATTPPAAPPLQVIGPGNAARPLLAMIASAHQRILVEAFALADPAVITALQGASRRGIDVRALLDPTGLNAAVTSAALQAAGVKMRAPNPAFTVTHMDAVVVDAAAVAILTTALTAQTLGPAGAAAMIVDTQRLDVLQVASIFYDDWLRRAVNRFSHNLVVLPDDAARLATLIGTSRHRIELYSSYVSDPGISGALRDARSRGVTVRVLTPPKSNNDALRALSNTTQVRFSDQGPGTTLVIDRRIVLMGSMDLSGGALSGHRELGVIVADRRTVAGLDRVFFAAFAHSVALRPLPPGKPESQKPSAHGTVRLSAVISQQVRSGGEGVIAVTTEPDALIRIAITYPNGSKPSSGTTGTSGTADRKGSFVYHWIVAGTLKPGFASVRIEARIGSRLSTQTGSFQIVAVSH